MFNVFLRIYILSIKICLIDRKGNSGACIENICCSGLVLFSFFFKELIYLFLESREGKQTERERNINVWLPLTSSPTGDLAYNPGMCPVWESNQRPFGMQDGTQSTEPHYPGLVLFSVDTFKKYIYKTWNGAHSIWIT